MKRCFFIFAAVITLVALAMFPTFADSEESEATYSFEDEAEEPAVEEPVVEEPVTEDSEVPMYIWEENIEFDIFYDDPEVTTEPEEAEEPSEAQEESEEVQATADTEPEKMTSEEDVLKYVDENYDGEITSLSYCIYEDGSYGDVEINVPDEDEEVSAASEKHEETVAVETDAVETVVEETEQVSEAPEDCETAEVDVTSIKVEELEELVNEIISQTKEALPPAETFSSHEKVDVKHETPFEFDSAE